VRKSLDFKLMFNFMAYRFNLFGSYNNIQIETYHRFSLSADGKPSNYAIINTFI